MEAFFGREHSFALFSELEVNSEFPFLSCSYSGFVIGYYMFQVVEVLDTVRKNVSVTSRVYSR